MLARRSAKQLRYDVATDARFVGEREIRYRRQANGRYDTNSRRLDVCVSAPSRDPQGELSARRVADNRDPMEIQIDALVRKLREMVDACRDIEP
jgi:hypothetical protein